MERISSDTAAKDMFGTGKNGFNDGDPVSGVATTELNASWFNGIQEGPARVIEYTGRVLDGNDHDQLLHAILEIAQGLVNAGSRDAETLDGHDSSFFAKAADLLAHLQDRSNPHGVTLGQIGGAPLHSPAFVGAPETPTPAVGDASSRIPNTAWVMNAISAIFGQLGSAQGHLGENGWFSPPGTLNGQRFIIQWGRVAAVRSEGTGPTITFPITFPHACLCAIPVDWNRNASDQWMYVDNFVQLVSVSPSGFSTFIQNPGSTQNHWDGCFWIAVGY